MATRRRVEKTQAPPAEPPGAKPFVKWAGGKRQLLPEIMKYVPELEKRATYHEPFVGGGALFFALAPKHAVLTDLNERLIRTYRAIKNDAGLVIAALAMCVYNKKTFGEMRKKDIDFAAQDWEVAQWFIYLNKTGFNGLYRVNRAGKFNVPFGRYTNPMICDRLNILACAEALKSADVAVNDFEAVIDRARPGDFVYFDPPYAPLSKSSDFTSFTRAGFTADDQKRLRDAALKLKAKRVRVLLSNSASPLIYDLYTSKKFTIVEVKARRNINSKSGSRDAISELLIY